MMDEDGVDFLGMRLIVTLVAAALLVAMAAAYVDGQVDRSSQDRARLEAARIADMARAEYAAGCPGSAASISVTIPGSVRRISFGGAEPDVYSIEFADGSLETHAAGCPFLPAVLYPGEHRLALEVAGNGTCAVSMGEA
jgi:hypothetical protein